MASYRLRQLYDAQRGVCPRCLRRMEITSAPHSNRATVDHVMPLARGGADHISNMLAMCIRCNGAKANRLPNGCDRVWQEATMARIGIRPFLSPPRMTATLR